MKRIRNIPVYIIIIIVVLVVISTYREPLGRAKSFFENRFFPCSKSITYSIGNVDSRFNLSKDQLRIDLAAAAKLWNEAFGKTLFEYEENGLISVNLIYDHRQEATEKLKKLGINIGQNENTYNTLKARYDSLNSDYLIKKSELDILITDYNQKRAHYDDLIAYWNNRGGAPKSEYAKLEAERKNLNAMATNIQVKQLALNQTIDTLNAFATTLNKLIAELNLKVNNYNNIGSSAGSEFQEGVFKSSFNSQQIDIYQFEDEVKLRRVLAHEFGHALGIEHVEDPEAIMYRVNQGSDEELTQADITALTDVCSSGLRFTNFNKVTP